MVTARPSPAQARLLRDLRDKQATINVSSWGAYRVLRDEYGCSLARSPAAPLATARACFRLGWIEKCGMPGDSVRGAGYRNGYFARISTHGLAAIEGLPEDAFASKPRPYMSVKGETARLLRALATRHHLPEWVFLTEVMSIDALAISCYYSQKFRWVGYEVKVSRSDFLREFKNGKTAARAAACNEFYFVVPWGMVRKEEVPDPYGLMNVGPKGGCRIVKRATYRETLLTPAVVASLLRHVYQQEGA